jgi:hypothetical protein
VAQTVFSGSTLSVALLIGGGLQAAAPPSQGTQTTVIAVRSSEATAASGRRPISSRIALARKPIRRAEPPTATTPAVEAAATTAAVAPPQSEIATHAPASGPVADAAPQQLDATPEVPAATAQRVAPVMVDGFLYPPSVVANSGANAPAQLAAPAITLQVTESLPEARRGGPIEWRLKLCNAGSEPATHVHAVLFFADGIEPVAASGATASLGAGEVRFDPLETLAPGEIVELQVTGVGTSSGDVQYRAEVVSSDLPETIAHDGVIQVTNP